MQRIPFQSQDCIEALTGNRYFRGLSPALIVELAGHTRLCRCQVDELLLLEGEPSRGLCILRSGRIKLFRNSTSGREMILKTLNPGDSFNEVPVFDRQGNPVSAAALEESEIWLVDADKIRDLVQTHPEAAHSIVQSLAQNLRMLVNLTMELSLFPVTSRLVSFLLAQPPDVISGAQPLRITQDELASRIGTVREVAARALKELEQAGAIQLARSRIRIADKDKLAGWK